jgi:hypothetical protein
MRKMIVLATIVALLTAAAITVATKLPKPAAAAHHSAAPIDPLHGTLQRSREEMALP